MAIIVKMPKLGLEMEQGIVLEWFFGPGDSVSEGDVIAEIESEKSIGEVEAREDGVLRRIYLEEGESVPPGKPIGILAAADADISELEAAVEAELDGVAETAEGSSDEQASDPPADTTPTDDQATESPCATGGAALEVKASPRAKKQAEELGVDLTSVEGTGPMDSITADDVEAAASETDSGTESVKASPRAKKRAGELDVDLTSVEGTGPMDSITADDVEAAAASESTATAASVRRVESGEVAGLRFQRTTTVAAPETGEALLDTTEAVRGAFEEAVTTTDVLVVVASEALSDVPVVNGTYSESTHQLQAQQDIALVTEVDGAPTTGTISDVGEKSLTELVAARESLDGDDDRKPSFTLSNTAGVDSKGLLVNQPGVAALEVDPSGQRAVPDGDGVELQPLVTASLTYDTHALGESEADAFLDQFLERASQASELVLESYRGKE
ncbi:E3 binding domain-containing protein [Haloarchaeobius sp. DFWS5]|uniref:E3 binding domain-containing protein n=1 Tax=Haloarchaeobius sp. DFWS5 TaxID=3446114 RepID=UPI003EB9000F